MRRVTSWGIALLLLAGTLSVAFAATPGRERGATSQVRIEGFDPLIPTLRKMGTCRRTFTIFTTGAATSIPTTPKSRMSAT